MSPTVKQADKTPHPPAQTTSRQERKVHTERPTHRAAQAEAAPAEHRRHEQAGREHDEPKDPLLLVRAVVSGDRALVLGVGDPVHRRERPVPGGGAGLIAALVLPE